MRYHGSAPIATSERSRHSCNSVKERLEYLVALMESELDLLQVEKRIRGRVKEQMEKSQREYYLNEQMKAIQEMNDFDEAPNEVDAIQVGLKKRSCRKKVEKKPKLSSKS